MSPGVNRVTVVVFRRPGERSGLKVQDREPCPSPPGDTHPVSVQNVEVSLEYLPRLKRTQRGPTCRSGRSIRLRPRLEPRAADTEEIQLEESGKR